MGGKGPEEMRFFFFRRLSLFFSVKEEKKLTAKHEKPFNVSDVFFRRALWKVFRREDWKMKFLFQGGISCAMLVFRDEKIFFFSCFN